METPTKSVSLVINGSKVLMTNQISKQKPAKYPYVVFVSNQNLI